MSDLSELLAQLTSKYMQSIFRNKATSPQDPFVLNLKTVKKASLFDTIHLLLLVETLSDQEKYVKIIFPDDIKVRGFLKYIGFTDFLKVSISGRPQGKYLSFFSKPIYESHLFIF